MNLFKIERDFKADFIVALVVLAVTYNALLAIVNAHIMTMSFGSVAAFEIGIIAMGFLYLLYRGIEVRDSREMAFLYAFMVVAVYISMMNSTFFIESLRNVLVIVLFVMLGRRLTFKHLRMSVVVVSVLIALILLIEMIQISLYVDIFEPAKYFADTRGIKVREYNTLGIYHAALGFEGRFDYGLYNGPRTSSLYLEQVSLSNFAIVLSIFLLAFWNRLGTNTKLFFILLILTILITSRSRSALGIIALNVMIFFMVRGIPKQLPWIIFPASIIVAIVGYMIYPTTQIEDTFMGRLSHSGHLLLNFRPEDLFGLDIGAIKSFADSGLAYTIGSMTVFGSLLVWLYMSTMLKGISHQQVLLMMLVNVYFFATLTVSGNSVFSIKTAAILWLMVGFSSSLAKK